MFIGVEIKKLLLNIMFGNIYNVNGLEWLI